MSDLDRLRPTERFTDRVDDYVRHRPSYPAAALDCMRSRAGIAPGAVIADIGAGPGILSRLLLERGHTVHAVEPNRAMREAAERALGADPRFHAVAGRAEATGLPADSVDAATCAQSFHWFVAAEASRELRRVVRPGGPVVLLWNTRRVEGSAFLEAYERFLERWGIDYETVRDRYVVEDSLRTLFGAEGWTRAAFPNDQVLDLEGLRGRLVSSSYAPPATHPDHEAMIEALHALFAQHAQDGHVVMEYDTELFWGEPDGTGRG